MAHRIKLSTLLAETEISVGENLTGRLGSLDPVPVLLVDEQVMSLHGHLFDSFPVALIPSGEQHKTIRTVERIYRELARLGTDRSSMLVGIGGGVATDVAGFAACTYMRGIRFGFIATTLLGQVDAGIGGKNGVNLDGYKNMVGVIRQPAFVWCDLSLLETLARREYVAGIAEVIKYGAIRNREFLSYLGDHMEDLLSLDREVLTEVVTMSVSVKVDIVQQDEHESGIRRLLNFGHTLGHAIERDKKILHGEAVALGMMLAARLSHTLGYLTIKEVSSLEEVISAAGLPVDMNTDPDKIYDNIRKDKKKSGAKIHFVLLDEPGRAFVREIPLSELKIMLHDLC